MNGNGGFLLRHYTEQHQRVVQFICIGRLRPGFVLHFVDRSHIENAETIVAVPFRSATHVNSLSPALFQRRIIEKRIWPRI